MRRYALLLPALLLLAIPTASFSAPLKPKMNEPDSYHDVHFGIGEVKTNVDSVTCGGWDPQSRVKIEEDPTVDAVDL